MKFAHLFKEGNDLYLFVDKLGNGCFSLAQRVWHVESGKTRVRKVTHRRLRAEAVKIPDNEVRILSLLTKAPSVPGITPRFARLLAHSDIPSTPELPTDPVCWTRVSYWDFYNGGELADLVNAYGKNIPLAIVSRYARQVLETLEFCYKANVIHGDLNTANVWVHWDGAARLPDFYIGDFGLSDTLGEVNRRSEECGMCVKSWDIPSVRHHIWLMLSRSAGSAGQATDVDAVIKGAGPLSSLFKELETMDRCVRESQASGALLTKFPSLATVIQMAKVAEVHFSQIDGGRVNYRAPFEGSIAKAMKVTPLYYDNDEAPLQARQVLGPWYVAKVDPSTRRIAYYGNLTHSRPNTGNSDSESDCPSDGIGVKVKVIRQPAKADGGEDGGWTDLADSMDSLSPEDGVLVPLLATGAKGNGKGAPQLRIVGNVQEDLVEAFGDSLI